MQLIKKNCVLERVNPQTSRREAFMGKWRNHKALNGRKNIKRI